MSPHIPVALGGQFKDDKPTQPTPDPPVAVATTKTEIKTMETKPGFKTSEFIALIAGLIVAIVPVVLDKVPSGSVWAVILGAVLAAATYIGGRNWIKVGTIKADAMKSIGNPTRPSA